MSLWLRWKRLCQSQHPQRLQLYVPCYDRWLAQQILPGFCWTNQARLSFWVCAGTLLNLSNLSIRGGDMGEGGVGFICHHWYSWTSDERHTLVALSDHLFWNHVLLSMKMIMNLSLFWEHFHLITYEDGLSCAWKVVATFGLNTQCLSYCLDCAPSSAAILLCLLSIYGISSVTSSTRLSL